MDHLKSESLYNAFEKIAVQMEQGQIVPDLRHQENVNIECQKSYDARHKVMNAKNNLNSVIRDIYEKMDRGYQLAEVAEEEDGEPGDLDIGAQHALKEEMGKIYKMAQE